jgi:ribosomal protein S18 acetylase RimI-like enzyme
MGDQVMPEDAVRLTPMTDAEARAFLRRSREAYADTLVRAGAAADRAAVLAGLPGVDALLPRRDAAPPDAVLWHIEEGHTAERVGALWFVVRGEYGARTGFVQDFVVFAPYRRRGHGRAALLALEDEARRLGLDRIALNVFAANGPARALYDRLGYREQSIVLAKAVGRSPDAPP